MIQPRPGPHARLVTGRFRHESANTLDLTIVDESGKTLESIGVTGTHPFWSEDRFEFVPASDLQPDETLLSHNGNPIFVGSITPRAGPEAVFNLEVDGEHVYYVSRTGVLAHNTCTPVAPQKINLNSNNAVAHFGVYEIHVNGALYKIGKSDLGRITKSSGLPTRLHQQVRKLERIFGRVNVSGRVVEDLGQTTTLLAKQAEYARIFNSFKTTGFVPLGNWKSFRL